MPPRRRGRARGQIPVESEGQNEEGERSVPVHRRARKVDDEVDELAAHVDDMELMMARFQRMNPQTFNGDEPSSDAVSWLQHITGLFDRVWYDDERSTCVTLNGSGIQLAVGPQPLRLRNHNSGLAQRIMYGPFNPYIPIRSTIIGKSRVAIDPIAMRTSWRSNSDIASVTSIGYPRMSASGESSTTMHRLLHASRSHPIPTPDDPKFRPRGHQFKKKSGSSSSGSGSSSSSSPRTHFYGQCGGRHSLTQCVGVQGACNNCGQYGHFARVCPLAGSQHTAVPP
ncbi:hypothetical protein F511_24923 [Dorcoceras hygrometricum]|uniref:CCHC-type domain-containing protein n=1 Tax=Dorcoceras hygrometricum TaxID=472368 RepID=A0A2Z7B7R1_9LAMI|nr:hypothetical protein F511_24923 [Dorcoceras hygrometricum]